MGRPSKYTPEFREEAVRLHREQGASVAESARRLGLGSETLRKWVPQSEVDAGERAGATREEHAEIARLRRELRRVEEEKLILQKAAAYFRQGDRSPVRTYRLVDQERAHHAISLLCSVLAVSRQAYYAWRSRPPSTRELRDIELKALIIEVFDESRRT